LRFRGRIFMTWLDMNVEEKVGVEDEYLAVDLSA
jgi:hypothetical protein